MKIKILSLAILLLVAAQAPAQRAFTIEAQNYDINNNLDLRAVVSIFAESKNLKDFEMRLNDERYQISNLDLNNDGWIDYLRVVETSERDLHLVVIQAVLDRDTYQDVATIVVEKRNNPQIYVRIIGNPYLYGVNYIIEPVFVREPVIFTFFWSSHYRPWRSPYYWEYYPKFYHPRPPVKVNIYMGHIHRYIPRDCKFYYHTTVNIYHNDVYVKLHQTVRRNDYERKHPEKSFNNRNKGIANKAEFNSARRTSSEANRRKVNQTNENYRKTSSRNLQSSSSSGNDERRNQNSSRGTEINNRPQQEQNVSGSQRRSAESSASASPSQKSSTRSSRGNAAEHSNNQKHSERR